MPRPLHYNENKGLLARWRHNKNEPNDQIEFTLKDSLETAPLEVVYNIGKIIKSACFVALGALSMALAPVAALADACCSVDNDYDDEEEKSDFFIFGALKFGAGISGIFSGTKDLILSVVKLPILPALAAYHKLKGRNLSDVIVNSDNSIYPIHVPPPQQPQPQPQPQPQQQQQQQANNLPQAQVAQPNAQPQQVFVREGAIIKKTHRALYSF